MIRLRAAGRQVVLLVLSAMLALLAAALLITSQQARSTECFTAADVREGESYTFRGLHRCVVTSVAGGTREVYLPAAASGTRSSATCAVLSAAAAAGATIGRPHRPGSRFSASTSWRSRQQGRTRLTPWM